MVKKEMVIEALRDVYDPEIPINVYDLGLIYEINIKEGKRVHVLMTLTSPTCPTADYIKEMIEDAVRGVDGVESVEVELTFEPLWTPDRVTPEAKEELGLTESTDDVTVQSVFDSTENEQKQRICFNCSATDVQFPLISAYYKGENVDICAKCMLKFK